MSCQPDYPQISEAQLHSQHEPALAGNDASASAMPDDVWIHGEPLLEKKSTFQVLFKSVGNLPCMAVLATVLRNLNDSLLDSSSLQTFATVHRLPSWQVYKGNGRLCAGSPHASILAPRRQAADGQSSD